MSDTRGILHGQMNISLKPMENKPRVYDGSYEADPSKAQQILPTKDRLLREDITVLGIYYYEVTNDTGGKTVTIGRD